jgi:hypothetical protein
MGFPTPYKLELFFFESTVNQQNYVTMLDEQVFPQIRRMHKTNTVIFRRRTAPLRVKAKEISLDLKSQKIELSAED